MQECYEKGKVFERFGRIMAEGLFIDAVHSLSKSARLSPEERYLSLVKNRPEILHRVPLKHIASYLGIEPESLSRIRKRTMSK